MKDILIVAKFTAKDMLGRKSFRFSTLFILVLIVLGCNIPNFINAVSGGEGFEDTILIVDRDDIFDDNLEALKDSEDFDAKIEITDDSYETIKQKITDGEIASAIIIKKSENLPELEYIVKNTATARAISPNLLSSLGYLYTNTQASKLGLTPTQIQSLMPNFTITTQQTEETEIGGNIMVMMLMSLALFYAIYFCAYQVSSSITVEKTSKIIETLVTSTSPRNIVLGKTIGIGVVGLFQMILIIATAVISAKIFLPAEIIESMLDLSNITPYLGIMTLVYFILGYFAYALIYALTGSTVSKPEDIQAANTPAVFLCMIGFYLAYFTLTDPTSSLNAVAAILPISSPFCMPIRIMMGLASGVEVAISIAVLVITILVIAKIAIKIYSDAILNYGTKLGLGELFRIYKQK